MMMHTISLDATWEEHVQAFMDECPMPREDAEVYADALAGMSLIRPSDRMHLYKDARLPKYDL